MADRLQGSCLCKAVTMNVTIRNRHVDACHCSMCRTWGGGPLLAVECESDAAFDGKDNVAVFDSSEWAERGFCKHCGTHLFYRLKLDGHYVVPAGLLGDQAAWEFTTEIFIDEQPDYYAFANDTKKMTGAEVFAALAPDK